MNYPCVRANPVQIGNLKMGINPSSVNSLILSPPHMMVALKTGIITGLIGLAVRHPGLLPLTADASGFIAHHDL